MKELKDIEIKKGDFVYFEKDNGYTDSMVITLSDGSPASELFMVYKITKIERPVKYETIYESPKPILDKEEKQYLEAVIRPFKDRVIYIKKGKWCSREWLRLHLKDFISHATEVEDDFSLPSFKRGTMYKGMEVDKEYTLKELGLFE